MHSLAAQHRQELELVRRTRGGRRPHARARRARGRAVGAPAAGGGPGGACRSRRGARGRGGDGARGGALGGAAADEGGSEPRGGRAAVPGGGARRDARGVPWRARQRRREAGGVGEQPDVAAGGGGGGGGRRAACAAGYRRELEAHIAGAARAAEEDEGERARLAAALAVADEAAALREAEANPQKGRATYAIGERTGMHLPLAACVAVLWGVLRAAVLFSFVQRCSALFS